METWSVHHLYNDASGKLGSETASKLQNYASKLKNSGLPVVFTLKHLAKITDSDYNFLFETVRRKRERSNYRIFQISKRSGGQRIIHAASGKLLTIQQFLNSEILQKTVPHSCSYAFHPNGGIKKCASMHCGARWLIQFDLKDFFYAISGTRVYEIFKNLGYRNLLAFQLSRLCTTTNLPSTAKKYKFTYAGVLPQGAPTSPMLSNLAAIQLDQLLHQYSVEQGFVYTRYADDLTFSSVRLPKQKSIGTIRRNIIKIIRQSGFIENSKKIRIAGPGAKKIVLGLLVDGAHPRISKELYKRIDRHLYYAMKFGLKNTADHNQFESSYGFYNHLLGLLSYVRDVDIARWGTFNARFQKINSPFVK